MTMICGDCGSEKDEVDFDTGMTKRDGTKIYYGYCPPCRTNYGRYLHGWRKTEVGDATQYPTSQERDREDRFIAEYGRNAWSEPNWE